MFHGRRRATEKVLAVCQITIFLLNNIFAQKFSTENANNLFNMRNAY